MRQIRFMACLIMIVCCGAVAPTASAQDPSLLQAAELGDPLAQLRLGIAFATGSGAGTDSVLAVKWLEAAAGAQANAAVAAAAAGWLGAVYRNGMGVRPNGQRALLWFQRGVERGDGASAQNIAEMYYDGKLLKRDGKLVDTWYSKAAALYEQQVAAGDTDAAYRLARIYSAGRGVPQNKERAMALLRTVPSAVNPEAIKLLREIEAEVSGIPLGCEGIELMGIYRTSRVAGVAVYAAKIRNTTSVARIVYIEFRERGSSAPATDGKQIAPGAIADILVGTESPRDLRLARCR